LDKQHLEFAKGQDFVATFFCYTGKTVKLSANALSGATSLSCYPLSAALASGSKLQFGSLVVTLSGSAAALATSLSVTAIDAAIDSSVIGKELQSLSGYDLEFEARDASNEIAIESSEVSIDIAVDNYSATLSGVCELDANSGYSWSVWRRNTGSSRPLARGDLVVFDAGFTA